MASVLNPTVILLLQALRKIILLLLVAGAFTLPAKVGASPLPRIFKMIRAGQYAQARSMLFALFDHVGDDLAVNYGLAEIYYASDNPWRNIDSAQLYCWRSEIILQDSVPDKLLRKYAGLGVRRYNILRMHAQIYEEAFVRADSIHTVASWNHYLNHYGLSPRFSEAVEKRNRQAFEDARASFDYSSFQNFMDAYPDAREMEEARALYETLLYHAKTADSTWQEYEAFTAQYPQSPFATESRKNYERLFFRYSTRHHSLHEFVLFTLEHPDNPYVPLANDSIYVLSVLHHSAIEYEYFIRSFPSNPHIEEAWKKLYHLRTQQYTHAVISDFLKHYPDYPFKDQATLEAEIALLPVVPYQSEEGPGFYGLTDTLLKKVTLLPRYYFIDDFHNNMALFNPDSCNENCLFGFLNKSGETIIPARFSDAVGFSGICAPVASGNCATDACVWGFINRFGDYLVAPQYDLALPFKEHYSLVYKKGVGYGFVIDSGSEQILLQYANAHSFSDSLAAVTHDSLWGFIEAANKLRIPEKYREVADFHEGLCAALDSAGLWGYLDKKGSWILKPQFLKAGNFVNGKAQVMNKPRYPGDIPKLRFIDKKGKPAK